MSQSPLANPQAVQQIVGKVNALSQESILVDQGMDQAKRDSAKYVNEHNANFVIVQQLLPPVDALYERIRDLLSKARTIAGVKIVGHYDDFLNFQVVIIERIQTDQDRKDALEALASFVGEENPLNNNQLQGFNGVTEIFQHIWKILNDEAQRISGVLEKAGPNNLVQVMTQVRQELAPVKVGAGNVKNAVDAYSRKIN